MQLCLSTYMPVRHLSIQSSIRMFTIIYLFVKFSALLIDSFVHSTLYLFIRPDVTLCGWQDVKI